MFINSFSTFSGVTRNAPKEGEISKEFAFDHVVGRESQARWWLSATYEGETLFIRSVFDTDSVDHIRYRPTNELERRTLAWIAIYIANWQALKKNFSGLPAEMKFESSEAAACYATHLLKLDEWQPPQQSPAWVEHYVLALALTFNLQLAPPMSYDLGVDNVNRRYRAIVKELVEVDFDTTKLTTLPS